METDIVVLDGGSRVTKKYKVRVDLMKLSPTELEHLRAGIDSTLEMRRREGACGRHWHVPAHAVEVFIVK